MLGRFDVPAEARLLLDTNYSFTGTQRNPRLLWQQHFEAPASPGGAACGPQALQGQCSLLVDAAHPSSAEYRIAARPGQFRWLEARALARTSAPEFVEGQMTQFVVRFGLGGRVVRERTVQFQRVLAPGEARELCFFFKAPREEFDHVTVVFLHHGHAAMQFDEARLMAFDE